VQQKTHMYLHAIYKYLKLKKISILMTIKMDNNLWNIQTVEVHTSMKMNKLYNIQQHGSVSLATLAKEAR
jgi:hypothetical protein